MIEFKIVQAETHMEYPKYEPDKYGYDLLVMPYTVVDKSIVQVLSEMVAEGWQVHTIDLSLDSPKALMEREVPDED